MVSVLNRALTEAKLARNRMVANSRAVDAGLCQWGIVGTGYMGEQFARYLGCSEGSNVRAVCSRSLKRSRAFARRHAAVSCYDGVVDMARGEEGKLDVVYIATPVATHFDIAMQCLDAGLSVLCEKPLCSCQRKAKELFDVAEHHGALLFEGMWSRCLPTFAQATQWVSSEEIGRIREIRAAIRKPEQGGEPSVMLDFGAYVLSFAAQFLSSGMLTLSVRVDRDAAGNDRRWVIEGVDSAGTFASLRLSTTEAGDSSASLVGSKGSVVIPSQFNRSNVVELRDATGKCVERKAFRYAHGGFEHEIADVSAAVKLGAPTALDGETSLRSVALMEALLAGAGDSFDCKVML